jgi:integrase
LWPQVDLIERVIRLDPGATKNEESRVIPLGGELYETLVAQKALRDRKWPNCEFVFFREGERIRDFRGAWEEACRQTKMIDGEGKPTKLFHDLRRTGVRNLIRAGVPEKIAMAISGHKTRSVFDRYNIVSESDLKDAAAKLDSYLAKKTEATRKGPQRESRHTTGTQKRRQQS